MENRIPILIKNRRGDIVYSIYGLDIKTGYVIGRYLDTSTRLNGEIKEKRMKDLDVDMEIEFRNAS